MTALSLFECSSSDPKISFWFVISNIRDWNAVKTQFYLSFDLKAFVFEFSSLIGGSFYTSIHRFKSTNLLSVQKHHHTSSHNIKTTLPHVVSVPTIIFICWTFWAGLCCLVSFLWTNLFFCTTAARILHLLGELLQTFECPHVWTKSVFVLFSLSGKLNSFLFIFI